MKRSVRRQLERRKRKIEKRLGPLVGGTAGRAGGGPELTQQRPGYEISERTQAIACGGIGAVQQLVRSVGLAVTEHPNPATEEHLKSGHFG